MLNAGFHITLPTMPLPVTEADLRLLAKAAETQSANDDFYEHLFQLDGAPAAKCEGWESFFVTTLAAHLIWDLRPTGVINEQQGEWLIRQCGIHPSPACSALLVEIKAQAHRVPIWFGAAVKARLPRASA